MDYKIPKKFKIDFYSFAMKNQNKAAQLLIQFETFRAQSDQGTLLRAKDGVEIWLIPHIDDFTDATPGAFARLAEQARPVLVEFVHPSPENNLKEFTDRAPQHFQHNCNGDYMK